MEILYTQSLVSVLIIYLALGISDRRYLYGKLSKADAKNENLLNRGT